MRIKLSRSGYWLSAREGKWKRHKWISLAPFVLIPSVLFTVLESSMGYSTAYLEIRKGSGEYATNYLKQTARVDLTNLFYAKQPPLKSEIPTIMIYVETTSLNEMLYAIDHGKEYLGHDPGGDRPYVKANYKDESGVLQRAKIAFRGAGPYHHYMNKPSLRVKIKQADIARDQRYVELIRPKDDSAMLSQVSDMVSEKIGLVTTINDPVRLFINGKYFGVYLRSYRPGEEFAIANNRMPGTFFKGDSLRYKAANVLWENVDYWDAFDDASAIDKAFFGRFLEVINSKQTEDDVRRLWDFLDFDQYAKWSAVAILTGNTHTDVIHNQVYYMPANQGKLEAVPWDPGSARIAPVDNVMDPVMSLAERDVIWVHRRNEYLWSLMQGPGSIESIIRWADERLKKTMPDLMSDTTLGVLRTPSYREPISTVQIQEAPRVFRSIYIDRYKVLDEYFLDSSVFALANGSPNETQLSVSGRMSLRVTSRDGSPLTITNSNGRMSTLLHPGKSAPQLQSDDLLPVPVAEAEPLEYTINKPIESLLFFNAITGQVVLPRIVTTFPKSRSISVVPNAGSEPQRGTVTIGPGVVEIKDDLIIGKEQNLLILPGTTLRINENTSLFSYGKTIAVGTEEKPIIIEPLTNKPWGTFSISGKNSGGTELVYLRVHGGSLGTNGGQQFKGMVNVYNCPGVKIDQCWFGKNIGSDDTVNLAESKIRVTNSVWQSANSDALDLDMCTGIVRDCKFLDSGNDGLDLMTCKLRVRDCLFQGSGDKGISIGEATQVLVMDSVIKNCRIGIEPKDNARAIIQRTLFENNKRQIHAYQKKYVYSRGGSCLLDSVKFIGSNEAKLEKRTALIALHTTVTVVEKEKSRLAIVKKMPDDWSKTFLELDRL